MSDPILNGEIANSPISVDFSDVKLDCSPQLFRVVTVVAVLPAAQGNGIAEDIRSSIIKVFAQDKSR